MAKWITIVLSVCGLAVGALAVAASRVQPPEVPLAREASVNPYSHGIASLGVIEPSGRVVSITAPTAGLVTSVLVDVGEKVVKGQALMTLDTRELEADLELAKAAVPLAEAEIAKWHALPRGEDLPAFEALVGASRADLDEKQIQLRVNEEAFARGAATERDVATRRAQVEGARATLAKAQADLDRVKAGGWAPDLVLAEAVVAQRRAQVKALETRIERLTVRAPRDGTVLRREIEPGEYATTDTSRAVLLIGDLSRIMVRAQIDEEDIASLGASPGLLKAIARSRGAVVRDIPLKLERVEPFARAKRTLSGENSERVDTRVVDVVLTVEALPDIPLYPGQAVDVFIDTPGVR